MKNYYKKNAWKIIEDKYTPEYNQVSESIFSIGNGRMGQRANFEEKYSGKSLQGSYIAGIYYPDKTKVGWWKNGYPEYFAKVLNSVNWIGINLKVNGKEIDLNKAEITMFHRELDMNNGLLSRTSTIKINEKTSIEITAERFYSLASKDMTFLKYEVKNIGKKAEISLESYLDFDVWNEDTNYDEPFWSFGKKKHKKDLYWIISSTKKTDFTVLAAQKTSVTSDKKTLKGKKLKSKNAIIGRRYQQTLKSNQSITLTKTTAICSTFYYPKDELAKTATKQVTKAAKLGYTVAKNAHTQLWNEKWANMDVTITGDVSAQQGIRYNIFQLHQTYTGDDHRLNIGPKGFTGEKYGGSTYWDTEAYCLPFYLSTASKDVSRSLLKYRFDHLPKAIENAEKLGFNKGAALYPMVTMNGEECHNEWEITFEEIHRNGAIAYAIYDYVRYTGDDQYIRQHGIDVLVAIARFWAQRVNWSTDKNAYVILGVTGPNEYENNVNNNWYTNYIAKWTLQYAVACYQQLVDDKEVSSAALHKRLSLTAKETQHWTLIANKIYLPSSRKLGIFLQQDGFLDKEQVLVNDLKKEDKPLNQKWSWDRILRSPYIKQADVLQGIYFFEEDFTKRAIEKNFDYYEPRTVHESSLSPCVHAILAASLGKEEKAYEMYLRTSRLDLDNYNNDTDDGLHITSMAGSWLSVIKGFAGMRTSGDILSFKPFIPSKWKSYTFKILHREHSMKIEVSQKAITVSNLTDAPLKVKVKGRPYTISAKDTKTINNATK